MASTIRDGGTQHWAGKARALSSERWLKRALGAALKRDRSSFLFLGLLPLLNAIFDYGSYALTFTLLRRGVFKPATAFAWGIGDLVAAGGFFLISGTGRVLTVGCANWLAGVTLCPLGALFDGIRAAPSEYIWLYVMLFSTILPTALHAGVGLFSLGAFLSPKVRLWLHSMIASFDPAQAIAAPLLIGLYWTLCLLIPCAVAWGLYEALTLVIDHPLG